MSNKVRVLRTNQMGVLHHEFKFMLKLENELPQKTLLKCCGILTFPPFTLPETNMTVAPATGWLEYDRFLLGWSIFRGVLVSFRECIFYGKFGLKAAVVSHKISIQFDPIFCVVCRRDADLHQDLHWKTSSAGSPTWGLCERCEETGLGEGRHSS